MVFCFEFLRKHAYDNVSMQILQIYVAVRRQ